MNADRNLTIDKQNYIYNIDNIKKIIGTKVELMAIVKANAYGHGAIEISKLANTLGIYYFGVATFDEAYKLRTSDIKGEILVLGHCNFDEYKKASLNNISVTVSDINSLEEVSKLDNKIQVHIKIDTGLSRNGFYMHKDGDIDNIVCLIQKISENSLIELKGLYTHFASSDSNEEFTLEQLRLFKLLIERLRKKNIKYGLAHCANSAAIIKYKDSHLDMVRPGLLTYGISPCENKLFVPKPIASLTGTIIQINDLEVGDYIGYSGTYFVKSKMRIAVVNLGYADGIPRKLSNKGFLLVNGFNARIVGRISMDVLTIDITNVKAQIYDKVIFFGESNSVYQSVSYFSNLLNTIEYEIFCNLGERIKRTYK